MCRVGLWMKRAAQLHITFGSSYKTSDFIVDTIEAKWNAMEEQEKADTSLIQIKMDNGPESSGRRTQFLYRMVQFADVIDKPIQLLYYPPYHSKYNPIERCWGILELTVEWDEADRCRDDAGVGQEDDLEGAASGRGTEPQSVPKGHFAREGGDAGG